MLQPGDILVLLRLVVAPEPGVLTHRQIAESLHIAGTDVRRALVRAEHSGLYSPIRRNVNRRALLEFLVHGVKYVYPPTWRQGTCLGVPTGFSAEPLAGHVVAPEGHQVVWPHDEGWVVGRGLEPLHPSAPAAALQDRELYELLVLVDALRIGSLRERRFARSELEGRVAA